MFPGGVAQENQVPIVDVVHPHIAVFAPGGHILIVAAGVETENGCGCISEEVDHSQPASIRSLDVHFPRLEVMLWDLFLLLFGEPIQPFDQVVLLGGTSCSVHSIYYLTCIIRDTLQNILIHAQISFNSVPFPLFVGFMSNLSS